MKITNQQRTAFLAMLYDQYHLHGRPTLPWRLPEPNGSFNPYKILVSELMLQQTQVNRVILKYEAFLRAFPDVRTLAGSRLGEVLRAWQGLGYNRRAKYLHEAASSLANLPGKWNFEQLVACRGIGPNTAAAILAYSYNEPVVFIETNVRTVYIHHFFSGQDNVHDKEIADVVHQTLDDENPREFYWALMDYGSYLKSAVGNLNKASSHYTRQSVFEGSRRQIRGQVIRLLSERAYTEAELSRAIPDQRLSEVLAELFAEHLICQNKGSYRLE